MWFNLPHRLQRDPFPMMIPDPATILACVLSVCGILLPGSAVLVWLSDRRRSWVEGLALAFGLGLSIIALGALLGRITGVRFTLPLLAVCEAFFAAIGIFGLIRRRDRLRIPPCGGWEIAALILLAVLLALRFYQARELALPAWVDSVHHAFLVRIFLERGGIPADLQPWIPGAFYYHYGFHAAAAVFSAFSGLPPDRTILIFGQILNAAIALSAYRLSMALRVDRRRALLVFALVGFVAQMPAFYLSWGRYTLLAGLVLLPLGMAEAIEFAARAPRRGTALRLAVLTAGLLLTHYLAALLLAVFLLLTGGYVLLSRRRRGRFAGLAFSIGAGTALALPWLIPMIRSSTVAVGVDVVASQSAADAMYFAEYAAYIWKLLGPVRNHLLLGAGLLAALAALFRRGPLRILTVWGLILGLQTLPWGLRIEPFRPDHLAIMLFLPAAILAADGFVLLADGLNRIAPLLHPRFFFAGAASALCVIGLWQTRDIVSGATVFAGADDREAVLWAGANTPADAVFLINTTPWQAGLYRGVDGGWWLPALAGRRTILPPMLYSFSDREFIDRTNALAAEVSGLQGCSTAFWRIVREQGVTHLFIKEGIGSLQPKDLEFCRGVEEIFRTGSVRIYRIDSTSFSGILLPATELLLLK
jgi:hypothetical protein